jgi:riboflavin synthase
MKDISVKDSVCIDGVCLTVTNLQKNSFSVDAVGVTLEKTTFNKIKEQTLVNLERSVRLSDRLGGHLVQGHVNAIGSITEIKKLGENYLVKIIIPDDLKKYLIREGSIAINGISLTIADVIGNEISLSIIPHTWQNTNLRNEKANNEVNVEIDILARYVEKLLTGRNEPPTKNITENWLKEIGY